MPPPIRSPAGPRAAQPSDRSGPCRNITTISIDGASAIDRTKIEAIAAQFTGKCLTSGDLDDIQNDIYKLYYDSGYPIAQSYIPEQDLSAGRLSILVVEGRLEKIVTLKNGKQRRSTKSAFPPHVGELFNLREYEQGLDIIDGLQSYRYVDPPIVFKPKDDAASPARGETRADVELSPGDKVGTSIVTVRSYQARPIYAIIGADSNGSSSTGRTRINAGITTEDLFGGYEALTVRGSHTSDFSHLADRARNLSADLALPFGYWSFHASANYFDYRSMVQSQGASFVTTGDQSTYQADLDRVVLRDHANVVSVGIEAAIKDVNNFIGDVKLDGSSRRLTTVGARVSHRGRVLGGAIFSALDLTQGIRAFDALADHQLVKEQPHTQFTRITGSIDFQRQFALGERATDHPRSFLQLHSYLTASWSPQALFGTEQVLIGGPFTVRGFDESSLSGDVGSFMRNELSLYPRLSLEPLAAKLVGLPSLFIGLDGGWIVRDYANPTQERGLAGVSGGVRVASRLVRAEARVDAPIASPSGFGRHRPTFRFSVSLTL